MAQRHVIEKDGDRLVASYSEHRDDATGFVVCHLWNRMGYAAYSTPFDDGHLELGVSQCTGPVGKDGIQPLNCVIVDMRMTEFVGRETGEYVGRVVGRTWAVPAERVEAAVRLALKAIEFYMTTATDGGRKQFFVGPRYGGENHPRCDG